MSLELRESCERCNAGLTPGGEAYICSYECTFCCACVEALDHVRPNCGVRRPRRAT